MGYFPFWSDFTANVCGRGGLSVATGEIRTGIGAVVSLGAGVGAGVGGVGAGMLKGVVVTWGKCLAENLGRGEAGAVVVAGVRFGIGSGICIVEDVLIFCGRGIFSEIIGDSVTTEGVGGWGGGRKGRVESRGLGVGAGEGGKAMLEIWVEFEIWVEVTFGVEVGVGVEIKVRVGIGVGDGICGVDATVVVTVVVDAVVVVVRCRSDVDKGDGGGWAGWETGVEVDTGAEVDTGTEIETGAEVDTGAEVGMGVEFETGVGDGIEAGIGDSVGARTGDGIGAGIGGGAGAEVVAGAGGVTEGDGTSGFSLDVIVDSGLAGDLVTIALSNSCVLISSFTSDFPSASRKLPVSWTDSMDSSSASLQTFLFLAGSQYTV